MMEQPKILVLCGGRFAFPSIQILGFEKYLCGVGIGKADPKVSEFLSAEMERNQFPFRSFNSRSDVETLRSWLDELKPDYIFSICFPFLVPSEALEYGENRFFNFHTGPLPAYRGPMPIFEVLRYGEQETAVCVHRMQQDFDEGPIVLTEPIPIRKDDTFGSLANKLSEHTSYIALNMAQMLEYGSFVPSTDQDESIARYFEFPEPEDTLIQWNRMSADEISDLIRACNPWNTGADAIISGKSVKILQAVVSDESHHSIPGTVLEDYNDGKLRIACMDYKQLVIEVLSSDYGIVSANRFLQLSCKENQFNGDSFSLNNQY